MDITLSGSNGRIQASYYKSANPKAPIAVIFHDLPKNGGHMNEKVNYTLFYAFLQMGFSVIRFNFRGCGNTVGIFEGGESELIDAATVVDWIQEQNEDASSFWLAGVGFGAWVSMQLLMRRMEVTNYIAVSPQPKGYDFTFFSPAPCDGAIIGAQNDSIILEDSLKSLANSINKQHFGQIKYISVPQAPHNYEGKLKELFSTLISYIEKNLNIPKVE